MFVIHGAQTTFGRSGYVALNANELEHVIKLERFVHIDRYDALVSDTYQKKEISRFMEEFEKFWYSDDRDSDQFPDNWLLHAGENMTLIELANNMYIPAKKKPSGTSLSRKTSFSNVVTINGMDGILKKMFDVTENNSDPKSQTKYDIIKSGVGVVYRNQINVSYDSKGTKARNIFADVELVATIDADKHSELLPKNDQAQEN